MHAGCTCRQSATSVGYSVMFLFFLMMFVADILNQSNVLVEGHDMISEFADSEPVRCYRGSQRFKLDPGLVIHDVVQRYTFVDSNSFYSTIAVGGCGAPRITEGGMRCPKGVSALGIHGVRRAVAAAAAVVRPWRS